MEGAALHRKIAFEDYQAAHGQTTLLAQDLVVRDGAAPAEVAAVAGEVTHVAVPDADDARALARVLSGTAHAVAAASSSSTVSWSRSSARPSSGARPCSS